MSVDIQITELVGGDFLFEHANSDVINLEMISEIGNYSYLINTSFVSFGLRSDNYSRAVGYYTVVDHGKMYQFSMIAGFSFETMVIIMLSTAVVVKYKRKK